MNSHAYFKSVPLQHTGCQWCEELSFLEKLKLSQKPNTATTINDFPLHSFYRESRKLKKPPSTASIDYRLLNPEVNVVYQSIIRKQKQKNPESDYKNGKAKQLQSSSDLSSKELMESHANVSYLHNSDNIGNQLQRLHQSRSQMQFTPRNEEACSHYKMNHPTIESRLTGSLHSQGQGLTFSQSIRDVELKYLREQCKYLRDRFYQHFKCAHDRRTFARK